MPLISNANHTRSQKGHHPLVSRYKVSWGGDEVTNRDLDIVSSNSSQVGGAIRTFASDDRVKVDRKFPKKPLQ